VLCTLEFYLYVMPRSFKVPCCTSCYKLCLNSYCRFVTLIGLCVHCDAVFRMSALNWSTIWWTTIYNLVIDFKYEYKYIIHLIWNYFFSATGTKFFVVCERGTQQMESLLKFVYELYTDYVLKNPFYEMEMPIRCELFDINLAQAVLKDRVALLGR